MRTQHPIPTPGAFFETGYPFVREKVTLWDVDGGREADSWRPGTRGEGYTNRYGEPDSRMVADGMGTAILTVVSTHKPGKFPTRVFFTRRWRDPDGKEFGKTKLRAATVGNFYALTRGFRHEYELSKKPLAAIAA